MKTVFAQLSLSIIFLLTFHCGAVLAQAPNERITYVGGRMVYIAWPGRVPADSVPVLLALHGSGREAESYRPGSPKGVPFYIRQRDLTLKAGYMFVSVSNQKDTWGTDAGLGAAMEVYSFVCNAYKVRRKWTLWGSSAGGVLMNRLVRMHPEMADRALGTFPVYDLRIAFARLKSAREAWGSEDAFVEVNPAGYSAALTRIPYLVFHGTDDQAVPIEAHSERLKEAVNGQGGKVILFPVPGGHNIENFALYDDRVILEFLARP